MDDWIRTPQSRGLMWAALVLSLVLGLAVVVVDHREPAGAQVGTSLTDEQAVEQVVGSARRIVAAAKLHDPAGGYTFVSCATESDPPYQVALYMSFTLPHSNWASYLDDVASAMVATAGRTRRRQPSILAGNSPAAGSRRWCNATLTTRRAPPCVCTASAAAPRTIGTTTRRGRKSAWDPGEAALQQESVEPLTVLESDSGEPPGADESAIAVQCKGSRTV